VIELLRKELRFKGVVMTDDLSDPALASFASISDAAVDAIKAGADMVYISGPAGDQRAAYVAVLRAVRSGRISTTRLDQAVLRILEAKRNYRLIR
jgi:beta-N-acetylhexosaminidase